MSDHLRKQTGCQPVSPCFSPLFRPLLEANSRLPAGIAHSGHDNAIFVQMLTQESLYFNVQFQFRLCNSLQLWLIFCPPFDSFKGETHRSRTHKEGWKLWQAICPGWKTSWIIWMLELSSLITKGHTCLSIRRSCNTQGEPVRTT